MPENVDIFDVAIIGGGFSGLMAIHHLVRTGSSGDHFAIIEPEEHPGYGLAYCTTNPRHLLNVPASNMSALPDQPDHFIKWLRLQDAIWQPGDYAPRCLYARYLDDIARDTFQAAKTKGIRVQHLRQKAVDIERSVSYRIILDNGNSLQSKAIILATGNLSSREKGHDFISDPWKYNYTSTPNESGPIAIIGTGLTMVDTVLSLREAGFAGEILAVSRRGLLPEIHDNTPAADQIPPFSPEEMPEKLIPLIQALRGAAKKQIAWQRVFDRWRPHIAAVWSKLDTADRKRFFDRFFTLWNVHRHRMAPEIGAFINRELAAGRLRIMKGGMQALPKDVQKVFDCRGPCHDISSSGNQLVTSLHRKGLIQRHETGWGLKTAGDLRVFPLGADGAFLAIGTALIGERLETTAVPELRQQAQQAALALYPFIRTGKIKNTAC